jgi:epoxyqueuosine reductase
VDSLSQQIKTQAIEIGFHSVGIAEIDPTLTQTAAQGLQAWLDLGYHADMAWMNDPRRQDIYRVMPNARSVIALALNYYTPYQRPESPAYGKVARYAWGRDYHKVLERKLKPKVSKLVIM